jgi:hypothetical protein
MRAHMLPPPLLSSSLFFLTMHCILVRHLLQVYPTEDTVAVPVGKTMAQKLKDKRNWFCGRLKYVIKDTWLKQITADGAAAWNELAISILSCKVYLNI